MFGGIRASPSPSSETPSMVEWLEVDRPHPKLLKDDSLSIYEATLVKLKQGSQRSPSSEHDSSPVLEALMAVESSVNASGDASAVSGLCGNTGICTTDNKCGNNCVSHDQEKKTHKDVSIRSLFSNYASSHQRQGS